MENHVENEWLVVDHERDHGSDKLICLSPASLQISMNGLIEARVIHMLDGGKVIDINRSIVQASDTVVILGSRRVEDLNLIEENWFRVVKVLSSRLSSIQEGEVIVSICGTRTILSETKVIKLGYLVH